MKHLLYIFAILLLPAGLMAGNKDKEKASERIIAGKVTDMGGLSLAGAKITIAETGEEVFADFEGNFRFTLKTDREYTISINNQGYLPLKLSSKRLSSFHDLVLKEL